MHSEGISNISAMPFFRDFIKEGDIRKFADNLDAFRLDLRLSKDDVHVIVEYFRNRNGRLKSVSAIINKIKKDISGGSIANVFEDACQFIDIWKEFCKLEEIFFPDSFSQMNSNVNSLFAILRSSGYPEDKLRELLSKAGIEYNK